LSDQQHGLAHDVIDEQVNVHRPSLGSVASIGSRCQLKHGGTAISSVTLYDQKAFGQPLTVICPAQPLGLALTRVVDKLEARWQVTALVGTDEVERQICFIERFDVGFERGVRRNAQPKNPIGTGRRVARTTGSAETVRVAFGRVNVSVRQTGDVIDVIARLSGRGLDTFRCDRIAYRIASARP